MSYSSNFLTCWTKILEILFYFNGPPGCGKTRVVQELIVSILQGKAMNGSEKNQPRILVCAPSNAGSPIVLFF